MRFTRLKFLCVPYIYTYTHNTIETFVMYFNWLVHSFGKNPSQNLPTFRVMTATLLAGPELQFSMVQVIDFRRGRIPYISRKSISYIISKLNTPKGKGRKKMKIMFRGLHVQWYIWKIKQVHTFHNKKTALVWNLLRTQDHIENKKLPKSYEISLEQKVPSISN